MLYTTPEYRTSDMYFAAYLRVAGVPLVRTERVERRVFFVFEEVVGMDDLKVQYFNRTAKVSALTYVDEIRNMKALLFA